jgi:hypothetical protein
MLKRVIKSNTPSRSPVVLIGKTNDVATFRDDNYYDTEASPDQG